MKTLAEPLTDALAHLEHRWGHAAVRLGSGRPVAMSISVEGALAPALLPVRELLPDVGVDSTGFAALDAILGPGGLVRGASVTLRGGGSSGKTTLALRIVAEAQRRGAIAAYLDLERSFDPLEAVARGVDLAWILILRATDATEGLRLAGALLSGRAVDLLVVDLPGRLPPAREELLRRLAARARQVGTRLVSLEPPDLAPALHGALAETAGVGLELERRAWIYLDRDVVGQHTLVTVARNRFGPPGRRVELEIRYADEGDRERGVARVLDAGPPGPPGLPGPLAIGLRPIARRRIERANHSPPDPRSPTHATALAHLAPPATPPRTDDPAAPRGAGRAGWPALGDGGGPRLQPRRATPGGPPRDGAGNRS